ncbi:MAG: DUF4143 domain-containing protein [Bacteroidales bacterium]|nr:DUF4143 domain-containing protein [Bacteroidales bacterium]
MIINDFQKYFYNKSERADLFFYRDKGQREVDLLQVKSDGRINAYEIKSSKTYRPDFFEGMHYLQNLLKERIASTTLLYDGNQDFIQQYDSFCNYRNLQNVIKEFIV